MCKTIDESKARPDVGCTELFGIFQWGQLKATGTKKECEQKAANWANQHGNVDLEVCPLPNNDPHVSDRAAL